MAYQTQLGSSMAKINLTGCDVESGGWKLRGAKDSAELNAVLNDLHDHCDGVDATASRLGVARNVVAMIARHYQQYLIDALKRIGEDEAADALREMVLR